MGVSEEELINAKNSFMHRFVVAPIPQNVWGIHHAFWFWSMAIGASLFLLRQAYDLEIGRLLGLNLADLLGLILIGIGGYVLISDLGRPERFIRALVNVKTSWISRGAVADFVFMFLVGLYLLPELELGGAKPFSWLPWSDATFPYNTLIGQAMIIILGLSAFIIIVYTGFVLASCASIPFWNNALLPLSYLASGMAAGFATIFLVAYLTGAAIPLSSLETGVALTLLGSLLILLFYLENAYHSSPTAKESARRLIRGDLASHFLLGVLVLGNLVPLALTLVAMGSSSPLRLGLNLLASLLILVGAFLLRYSTIKAGMYAPLLTPWG